MPVIPCPANLWQNDQELYSVLWNCQKKLQGKDGCQIVSFSQKIEPLDPLAVLQSLANPKELHFYWENRNQEIAIAAIGSAKSLQITGENRFPKSRQFIQKCLQETLILDSPLGQAELGPHFFCSFTFFDNPQESPFPPAIVFLPEVQVVRKKQQHFIIINIAVDRHIDLNLTLKALSSKLAKLSFLGNSLPTLSANHPPTLTQPATLPTSSFSASVQSALTSIQAKEFSKIVLAHALDVVASAPFNLIHSLHHLRQRHPDCYIFSTSNAKGYSFIGASPERLISIQNQRLITDALAGSAPRGKNTAEDASLAHRLLQSEKELREHQAVSQFLTQRLQKLGLKPQHSPVQLLQLSNIQHLWTPISATMSADVNPLDIVAQLHPTPAVAGVPTATACEQIRAYETFERCLYAAPLGWLDDQGNSEFIVGIRSALIKGNSARLYGGAGIVAGSDPQKELAEVQLKLQTLLKALV